MIIGIDCDGTIVFHEYPEMGETVPQAKEVIEEIVNGGHKIILYTMRSGEHLAEAVKWFANNKIPLWGINCNPDQAQWTSSPKVYCHIYIDDAALGCPLKFSPGVSRPFVDWVKVRQLLVRHGVI